MVVTPMLSVTGIGAGRPGTATGVARIAGGGGTGERDPEFLAADTRQQVAPAQMRAQSFGDGAEHGIARSVAVTVVDPLEEIQIGEHHRDALAPETGLRELTFEPGQRMAAVIGTGERIADRRGHARAQPAAQRLDPALAVDLACDAQGQFARVGGGRHHVVGPHVEQRDSKRGRRAVEHDEDGAAAGVARGLEIGQKAEPGLRPGPGDVQEHHILRAGGGRAFGRGAGEAVGRAGGQQAAQRAGRGAVGTANGDAAGQGNVGLRLGETGGIARLRGDLGLGMMAAQQVAQPRQQQRLGDRPGEDVVGPGAQHGLPFGGALAVLNHQNRHAREPFDAAQRTQEGFGTLAVEAGIGEDQVGRIPGSEAQSLACGSCLHHAVGGMGKLDLPYDPVRGHIVNNENRARHCGCAFALSVYLWVTIAPSG
jgi:hypothetical protein